jgi:hypothetical protein
VEGIQKYDVHDKSQEKVEPLISMLILVAHFETGIIG